MATLPTTPQRRRALGALLPLLSLVFSALLVGGTAGSASAADGYRYWNYFHVKDGAFAFASSGNASFVPKDGATEGYRYGTSTVQHGLEPRADLSALTFDKVCAGTKAQAGKKRVAVLVDYGTKADAGGAEPPAPRADCALVPLKANGAQVLDAVADVRLSKGMLCGVDGYPASGCGSPVKNATVPSHQGTVDFALPQEQSPATKNVSASQSEGHNTAWIVGGAVVVVLLVGGGLALGRRRQSA